MAYHKTHEGEFAGRDGTLWRVELLENTDTAPATAGVLTFEADEPLLLEWEERGKEEVIQGCMATLRVESPGDRTYEGLYSVEACRIRMDVYRDGRLYWQGTLDTEFYEEPYERASLYPVSLKFSDFGVMDRLKYDLSGMQTVGDILTYCLGRAGLEADIDQTLISTALPGQASPLTLDALSVRSDNFYDEDGEASTLEEVIEGILQPLGLRMVQRRGRVWIYDLNGLHAQGTPAAIEWDGDSQTMGADVVYNNARITWNTYAQSGNLMPAECWTEPTDPNETALNEIFGKPSGECILYSYYYGTDLAGWNDATNCGFTLWTSSKGKNATFPFGQCQFFKIVPQLDGDESEGIAISWTGVKNGPGESGLRDLSFTWRGVLPPMFLKAASRTGGYPLFRTEEVWLPPVDNPQGLLLRVSLNLMADPRFNPFEEAVNWASDNIWESIIEWSGNTYNYQQKDHQEHWKSSGNFLYVPVTVKFRPDGSDEVLCWDNRVTVWMDVDDKPQTTLGETLGGWMPYSAAADDSDPNRWGYLAWYDPKNRTEGCGVAQGWSMNRQAINPHTKTLTKRLEECDDGQYIAYPGDGRGGKLWMEVRAEGWYIVDGGNNFPAGGSDNPKNLWGNDNDLYWKMRHILMQLPQVEIVNNQPFDQEINTDDVEYSAELNPAAKEPIELETTCGTADGGVPTARGAYFRTDDYTQLTSLTRAGRTAQAEELLIGTLYSQYATRHTRLEGEAVLLSGPWGTLTEQNQPGKLFLVAADTQNPQAATSQAVIIELSPDEYDRTDN